MGKFLIFIDGTDDAAMYPLSRLLGVTVAAEGVVNLRFEPSFNGGPAGSVFWGDEEDKRGKKR